MKNKKTAAAALMLGIFASQSVCLPALSKTALKSDSESLTPTLMAQESPAGVVASPIPPIVSGSLDMEEFKLSNVIDLKVSQSRTFKTKNKIIRTHISDPSIAEPVIISENQFILLGKTPGVATMLLWDDAGNSVAVDLRVGRDFSQLQSTLREIDPRIIAKTYNVAGSGDRVVLLGDVDYPESVIRAFAAANVFMDDHGFNIQVANNRLITQRIGEMSAGGGGAGAGGSSGQLAQLNSVDKYSFFPNLANNIGRAQLVTSNNNSVTSMIRVRKMPLIVMHVTFMEMNTATARALGIQLGINFGTSSYAFGVGGSGNPIIGNQSPTSFPGNQINGVNTGFSSLTSAGYGYYNQVVFPSASASVPVSLTQMISGIGQPILSQSPSGLLPSAAIFGTPGGTSFGSAVTSLENMFMSTIAYRVGHGSMSLSPIIQGAIEQSRARILAEPTLVTISGERASFLAGGEVPVQQQLATAGTSLQSITFEPFGLRLNIIPILEENGVINLEISPEERLISSANALTFIGSTTPINSFTTRKTQTIVELKPGQELFIAGLISTNVGRELDMNPILGEVPVLGALYRSKAFSKNESELVVSVRPEIILPGTPGQLKLPEELGRVEGPRDTNMFQVEPSVIDERYYNSGRAERYQKTSPTLPEGSPVPDSL
jgi:Flp pilus assembly secretin CpaC